MTQGKRLRVICTVAEGDLPLEVIWKKNGIPILINPGVQGNNVQVVGRQDFTIFLFLTTTKYGWGVLKIYSIQIETTSFI